MKQIWERLSRREKGLVVASFVILLLVLVRYLIFLPFLERRAAVREQLEVQPQVLEKNLRYVNRKAEIEAGLEKARAEIKDLESVLLSGDTPSVSASSLQEVVQALAAKEGTQVITTRVLSPEPMGPFIRIPIQLEVGGQIDQLVNFIRGIGSTEQLLSVSELNVRSLFTPAAVRGPAAGAASTVPSLRASLIVSGFTRSKAASSQKSEAPPATTKDIPGKEGKLPTKESAKQ
jgi:Tfp pilus assembly protein PilO